MLKYDAIADPLVPTFSSALTAFYTIRRYKFTLTNNECVSVNGTAAGGCLLLILCGGAGCRVFSTDADFRLAEGGVSPRRDIVKPIYMVRGLEVLC